MYILVLFFIALAYNLKIVEEYFLNLFKLQTHINMIPLWLFWMNQGDFANIPQLAIQLLVTIREKEKKPKKVLFFPLLYLLQPSSVNHRVLVAEYWPISSINKQ